MAALTREATLVAGNIDNLGVSSALTVIVQDPKQFFQDFNANR